MDWVLVMHEKHEEVQVLDLTHGRRRGFLRRAIRKIPWTRLFRFAVRV